MPEVTEILNAIDAGDPRAAEQLLPLVYDELRKLAAAKMAYEKPGLTLDATGLVHEAYLRLAADRASTPRDQSWNSRGHFFAAAAEAMRRILIDYARTKASHKRGGNLVRRELGEVPADITEPDDILALNDALEQLTDVDAQASELVKLRYFAGLTMDQAAEALGVSNSTAERTWAYARSWLYAKLSG